MPNETFQDIRFETTLSDTELHELLCLAIHEGDMEAVAKLMDEVTDIRTLD